MTTQHKIRTAVASVISLVIIHFPRVHDEGCMHIDPVWLLLPLSILAGFIYSIKLLTEFSADKIGSADKKILIAYLTITAIYIVLIHFASSGDLIFRKTIITNYGWGPGEDFEDIVPVYFFEDLAHIICGTGFFVVQRQYAINGEQETFKRSLETFSIFLAILISVHFYYSDRSRPEKNEYRYIGCTMTTSPYLSISAPRKVSNDLGAFV